MDTSEGSMPGGVSNKLKVSNLHYEVTPKDLSVRPIPAVYLARSRAIPLPTHALPIRILRSRADSLPSSSKYSGRLAR